MSEFQKDFWSRILDKNRSIEDISFRMSGGGGLVIERLRGDKVNIREAINTVTDFPREEGPLIKMLRSAAEVLVQETGFEVASRMSPETFFKTYVPAEYPAKD